MSPSYYAQKQAFKKQQQEEQKLMIKANGGLLKTVLVSMIPAILLLIILILGKVALYVFIGLFVSFPIVAKLYANWKSWEE